MKSIKKSFSSKIRNGRVQYAKCNTTRIYNIKVDQSTIESRVVRDVLSRALKLH